MIKRAAVVATKKERTADCEKEREGVAQLIFLYLGEHEFCSSFHC